MEIERMFEKATREKTRFPYKGLLSVEDLWDLSVQELDKIYKVLSAKLRTCKEDSLLDTKNGPSEELAFQVAIVKYIVGVKLAEMASKEQEAEKKLKKQKIMETIAKKQDTDLEGKSIEELTKMVEGL